MGFCFPPFFRAIGHPVRQKILNELMDHRELSVNDLVKKLKLSQPTVSHHLAILKKAGVVKTRQEGVQTFYRLCCQTVGRCCERMRKFFSH